MFQINQKRNGEQFESRIPQKHVTHSVWRDIHSRISHFLSIFIVILIFIPFSRVEIGQHYQFRKRKLESKSKM